MATKIIPVHEEIVLEIEKLQYEVNARKEVIAYLINKNIDMDNTTFIKYNDEYLEYYIKYNMAKNKVEKDFVYTAVENPINWNLDFGTKKITITY